MSFSCQSKTLRSGKSYDLRTEPKMSTHADGNTGEAETGTTEGSEESNIRFSSELMDERIKASLEPLHAQIFPPTEMMDRLIQSNLTMESTTASTRGLGLQHESLYNERPGSSKFPTIARLTTGGYSPDYMFPQNVPVDTSNEVLKIPLKICCQEFDKISSRSGKKFLNFEFI